jgi:hypothetical protein
MVMQTGNMQPEDKRMPDNTNPVVGENDSCPHWECGKGEGLTPMKECWYCKYLEFRKETDTHRTHSICRCPSIQKN